MLRVKASSKKCVMLMNRKSMQSVRYCSDTSDRLHSTDIAYKPNESGWGYNKRYNSNFDAIFNTSTKSTKETTNINSTTGSASKIDTKTVQKNLYNFSIMNKDSQNEFINILKAKYPELMGQ